jgi:hypothetical protein
VPNDTLYVVPSAPAAQLRIGDVPTPAAPLAGTGLDAGGGGPTVPAVVNDHVSDVAIIAGLTGVAFVRDTTFQ